MISDLGWSLSAPLTLRLINTYRDWDNKQLAGDTIATSLKMLSVGIATNGKAQSHELQLISQKGTFLGNRLGFTSVGQPALIPACQAGAQTNGGLVSFAQNARSTAGYLQADYALLPNLELDVGARYTKDKKSASFSQTRVNALAAGQIVSNEGPYPLSFEDTNTSVRGSLSWHPPD